MTRGGTQLALFEDDRGRPYFLDPKGNMWYDSGDPAIRLGADVLAGSFAVDAGSLERVRNGVAAAFSARRTQMRGPAAEGAGEAACTDTWRDDLFVYTGRDTRDGASIKLVGVREGEEDGTISADEIEGIKSRF